ncbi:hypothetical protein DL762_008773 [Monosporascus cannonballus]|uniref:EKC/KEOPS complex subunit BUD32 n=1 Tax=Monosporascus cannonballus TaxID=155416 RepID=A0ABY0GZ80_9PEZI|nr:hypothetical protein DL762_008773 [Monosporascus cannonballus]
MFGSTSIFYKAPQGVLKSPRAVLKDGVINQTLTDAIAHEFVVERLILETLGEHPRIVRYYGWQDEPDTPQGLLLAEASHGSLQRYLDMEREIPIATRLKWCRQVIEAITFIHSRGVIHSDLRPDNVLLHTTMTDSISDSSSLDVWLCDFGGSTCERLGLDGHWPHRDPGPLRTAEDWDKYCNKVDRLFKEEISALKDYAVLLEFDFSDTGQFKVYGHKQGPDGPTFASTWTSRAPPKTFYHLPVRPPTATSANHTPAVPLVSVLPRLDLSKIVIGMGNQWTIMDVVMEPVDEAILNRPPRMINGRPECKIGEHFARFGFPKANIGPILETVNMVMPGVPENMSSTPRPPILAMHMLGRSSSKGIATITISVTCDATPTSSGSASSAAISSTSRWPTSTGPRSRLPSASSSRAPYIHRPAPDQARGFAVAPEPDGGRLRRHEPVHDDPVPPLATSPEVPRNLPCRSKNRTRLDVHWVSAHMRSWSQAVGRQHEPPLRRERSRAREGDVDHPHAEVRDGLEGHLRHDRDQAGVRGRDYVHLQENPLVFGPDHVGINPYTTPHVSFEWYSYEASTITSMMKMDPIASRIRQLVDHEPAQLLQDFLNTIRSLYDRISDFDLNAILGNMGVTETDDRGSYTGDSPQDRHQVSVTGHDPVVQVAEPGINPFMSADNGSAKYTVPLMVGRSQIGQMLDPMGKAVSQQVIIIESMLKGVQDTSSYKELHKDMLEVIKRQTIIINKLNAKNVLTGTSVMHEYLGEFEQFCERVMKSMEEYSLFAGLPHVIEGNRGICEHESQPMGPLMSRHVYGPMVEAAFTNPTTKANELTGEIPMECRRCPLRNIKVDVFGRLVATKTHA